MEYYECLELCKNELIRGYELGKKTFGHWMDEPIYPENEELYNEFVDDCGFDTVEFISYLIRYYNLGYDLYE